MIGVVKKNGGSLEELGRKVNLNAQNIDADSRAALRDKLGVENLPNDLATTEDIERATAINTFISSMQVMKLKKC